MDRDDFAIALQEVEPGKYARMPYEIFELVFPPGVGDDHAKGAAYEFARERGFRIENHPEDRAVWFVKEA